MAVKKYLMTWGVARDMELVSLPVLGLICGAVISWLLMGVGFVLVGLAMYCSWQQAEAEHVNKSTEIVLSEAVCR